MMRQSLDADSPYADVALHGSGLTSLQYREEKAQSRTKSRPTFPRRAVRMKSAARYFSLWLAEEKGEFHLASGSKAHALPCRPRPR